MPDQESSSELPPEAGTAIESSETKAFGWRQLFGAVNLHDFADMVRGEGIMIGTMVRRAFSALPRLPFGPFIFATFMMLAWLRAFLLFLVVFFFGGAIALISVMRGLSRRSNASP
jgi:prepilin signal peptidase PulO-like enzyme (type II secretory pathway)